MIKGSYIELLPTDMERSIKWYEDNSGLKTVVNNGNGFRNVGSGFGS